jgi:hypothetical protein
MQFPTLALLASIMAAAVSAQESDSGCTYMTASYHSVCSTGENLFCSGNRWACPRGKTDTFDEVATKANEESCKGLTPGNGCTQTIACC